MIGIVRAITGLLKAAVKNPKNALIIILVAVIGWNVWQGNRKQKKINELAERLAIKPTTITITTSGIETTSTTRDGGTVTKRTYVPPEGKVLIDLSEKEKLEKRYAELVDKINKMKDVAELGALKIELEEIKVELEKPPEVTIKVKGFTFRPGYSILYEPELNEMSGNLDIKWIYYKRYSLTTAFGLSRGNIGITRHIDDVIAIFRNIEIGIYYGMKYENLKDTRFTLGVRANF